MRSSDKAKVIAPIQARHTVAQLFTWCRLRPRTKSDIRVSIRSANWPRLSHGTEPIHAFWIDEQTHFADTATFGKRRLNTHFCLIRAAVILACLGVAGVNVFAADASAKGFQQRLSLLGVTFSVSCPNKGSANTLRVVPSGKIAIKKPIATKIDGIVTGAEIADLNGDGWPELVVFVTSAGSGSYGSLVGYSVNAGKSVTEFKLPDLLDDPLASQGYLGHDEFAIIESTVVRRFPIYREGDSNAQPTGGSRQISYQLVPGEATVRLKMLRK